MTDAAAVTDAAAATACVAGCDAAARVDLVRFPSVSAEVSVDTVEFLFFAPDAVAPKAEDVCPLLLQMRALGEPFPASVGDYSVPECALTDADAGAVNVMSGLRAVLAIAKRGSVAVFVGCSIGDVGPMFPHVVLSPVDGFAVPPTRCITVADHCAGHC
jgi:hypothetical protein